MLSLAVSDCSRKEVAHQFSATGRLKWAHKSKCSWKIKGLYRCTRSFLVPGQHRQVQYWPVALSSKYATIISCGERENSGSVCEESWHVIWDSGRDLSQPSPTCGELSEDIPGDDDILKWWTPSLGWPDGGSPWLTHVRLWEINSCRAKLQSFPSWGAWFRRLLQGSGFQGRVVKRGGYEGSGQKVFLFSLGSRWEQERTPGALAS